MDCLSPKQYGADYDENGTDEGGNTVRYWEVNVF